MGIVSLWSGCIGKTKQIWFHKLEEPIKAALFYIVDRFHVSKNGQFALGLWGDALPMENK